MEGSTGRGDCQLIKSESRGKAKRLGETSQWCDSATTGGAIKGGFAQEHMHT